MKILVSEKLSEHKYKTPEGYLICTDAVLARTGKQTYTKDEVFGDGDNTEIDVDRPYDQVMNEKTIASFENKPVTFDHPDEDVNVGNYKDYAVGYVRDVHQGKVNGQDVILGNLVITDQDAINAIESGEHTDLSCGYDCDIKDDGDGNYSQNNIRGNHVALCREGRAGTARIVDSIKDSYYIDYSDAEGPFEDYFECERYARKFNLKVISNPQYTSWTISGKKDDLTRFLLKYYNKGQLDMIYDSIDDITRINDSKVKDDNLLGKRVRIHKRYSNLDGTIGTIYSYEGTNYDDEVEVERNGHIYKVDYEDIEFLDSKVEDANWYVIYESRIGSYYTGLGWTSSSSNAKKYASLKKAKQAIIDYGITNNSQLIIIDNTGKTCAETIRGRLKSYDSIKDSYYDTDDIYRFGYNFINLARKYSSKLRFKANGRFTHIEGKKSDIIDFLDDYFGPNMGPYSIRDSIADDYSSFEKLRKDRDFMEKLETLAKDAKNIKQLRQWLTDNPYFNQLNNAEIKLLLKHELGIDLNDSKQTTLEDALKVLNFVKKISK